MIAIVGDYAKVKDQLAGYKDITFLDTDGKTIRRRSDASSAYRANEYSASSRRAGGSRGRAARSPTSSATRWSCRAGGRRSTSRRRAAAARRARPRPPRAAAHQGLAAVHARRGSSSSSSRAIRTASRSSRRGDFDGRGVWTFEQDGRVRRHHLRLAAARGEAAAAQPVVPAEAAVRGEPPVGDGAGRGEPEAGARAPPRDVRGRARASSAAAGPGHLCRRRRSSAARSRSARGWRIWSSERAGELFTGDQEIRDIVFFGKASSS